MPYCPNCGAEYREGFKVCIDCKVALVSERPEAKEAQAAPAGTEESAQKYRELLARGEEAFDQEDYKRALRLLNSAIQLSADQPHPWNLLGLTYQALGHEREAWRSFKFALRADPDDRLALWYAANFLFEQEDFPLAMTFISRYLELETDPEEVQEAEQLKKDISYHLQSLEELNSGADSPHDDFEDDEDEEVPSDKFTVLDDGEEVIPDEDYSEEEEELEAASPSYFEADLDLMLTDRNSKCLSCGAALPTDAPYCYNCKEPHLYRPL